MRVARMLLPGTPDGREAGSRRWSCGALCQLVRQTPGTLKAVVRRNCPAVGRLPAPPRPLRLAIEVPGRTVGCSDGLEKQCPASDAVARPMPARDRFTAAS